MENIPLLRQYLSPVKREDCVGINRYIQFNRGDWSFKINLTYREDMTSLSLFRLFVHDVKEKKVLLNYTSPRVELAIQPFQRDCPYSVIERGGNHDEFCRKLKEAEIYLDRGNQLSMFRVGDNWTSGDKVDPLLIIRFPFDSRLITKCETATTEHLLPFVNAHLKDGHLVLNDEQGKELDREQVHY